MVPVINYSSILQELKTRLNPSHNQDDRVQQVGALLCRRLATFWGSRRPLPLEEALKRLEKQWQQDGLLRTKTGEPMDMGPIPELDA